MIHIPMPGVLGKVAAFTGHHAPLILITTAAVGAISSCVMTIKATTKAEELLERRRNEIAYETETAPDDVEMTPRELFKTCWKLYLAPAICLVMSVACMFVSLRISTGRTLAMTALYSSSQEALRRYEDKVIETVGEKTNANIKNAVIEQRLKDNPAPEDMVPGRDLYLCYDDFTDRYWMGNLNAILDAASRVNDALENHVMHYSLNEFFMDIGLPRAGCGDDTGWTPDEPLDLTWTTKRAANGHPCVVILYELAKNYNHGRTF